MKIIRKPEELQKAIEGLKKKGKTIGLVPTMGALHAGHISLMKKSVSQNDITVVSVYVNPIQFGPNEDYERYPRPVEHDIKVCKDNKVDFLFLPTNKTLYNDNFSTYIYNNMKMGETFGLPTDERDWQCLFAERRLETEREPEKPKNNKAGGNSVTNGNAVVATKWQQRMERLLNVSTVQSDHPDETVKV